MRQRDARYGFTLIELVVTIAIMAVIMVGIGSAMIIVSHAVPTADNAAAAVIAASQVVDEMATELQYAVSVVDSNATVIEFTVADRDGNDVPERIRYEWSGTPGDPLTRRYNGGVPVAVLADVNQFEATYDLKTVTEETESPNESAEAFLSGYSSTSELVDLDVKNAEWHAQYFLPSLPADAVSWKVTRVRFNARSYGGTTGETRVQLQVATVGGFPSGIVLEEKTLLESTLPSSYTQQELTFSHVEGLARDQGLCLVFKWISDSTACRIQNHGEGATPTDGHLLTSTSDGSSWHVRADNSLLYSVYGTVTTAGEPQIEATYHLGGATLTLQGGDDVQGRAWTAVRILNEPEVTP